VDALIWSQATEDMRWPITLSADGRFALGGSDDGYVNFFGKHKK
jgi:hypothetical protein